MWVFGWAWQNIFLGELIGTDESNTTQSMNI